MRRFIIDTDTGGDDAIAILMMLMEEDVSVEAITTVSGNVEMEQATKNALATMELIGGDLPPLYKGAYKPLMRELIRTVNAHGNDGMGDCGLVAPKLEPRAGHAVDVICELAKKYAGELELLMIGPATNVALAIMKDPDVMRGVKHIWSMGTGGFSQGMETAVAEFNVLVDAEAYSIVLDSGIPTTIIGFDLCMGDAAFDADETERLRASGAEKARFAVACNSVLLEFAKARLGYYTIPIPDAVAAAAALWPDVVLESEDRYCYTCYKEQATYGQVILFQPGAQPTAGGYENRPANATGVKQIDNKLFKSRLLDRLTQ